MATVAAMGQYHNLTRAMPQTTTTCTIVITYLVAMPVRLQSYIGGLAKKLANVVRHDTRLVALPCGAAKLRIPPRIFRQYTDVQ